jgi:Tol biopolymer transport system component
MLIRLGRAVAVIGTALAISVALGCGSAGGAPAKKAVPPCGTATGPTWSPDGTQIAWYGFRWPRPPHHHAAGSSNTLQAICVSDAGGKHLHRLANTACSEHCSSVFSDPPDRLAWVAPTLLLAGNDLGIYKVSIGQRPKLLGRTGPVSFSVDANGNRVASGVNDCSGCAGPVKIRSVSSGAVVGLVGGTKVENSQPSLSPDGTQVAFTRRAKGPAGAPSIWTADADGSHLQRLEKHGSNPLWSPAGNEIAYLAPTGGVRYAWRVVSSKGTSRTLLPNGSATAFGWSPDGHWLAVPDSNGKLAVVDATTGKVRRLLKLQLPYASSSVAWSPDSRRLLVVWRPPAHTSCPSGLWRVPVDGSKPRLVHGC